MNSPSPSAPCQEESNSCRVKLITEGRCQLSKVIYTNNIIGKLLSSKLLRKWEFHRIVLTGEEITSKTPRGWMEQPVNITQIEDIHVIGHKSAGQKYCLRIILPGFYLLLQFPNDYTRLQWFHSILWMRNRLRFEKVLRKCRRPEVLIKEVNNMVEFVLRTPLQEPEVWNFPLEIVSDILHEQYDTLPKPFLESLFMALGPLLEVKQPSPELCEFFSKHCRNSPRSKVILEMFTPAVKKILKHNTDFGKFPRMRVFVQDYVMALNCQNDGVSIVCNFVRSMHGTRVGDCPFPRVLNNIVSVCLAAVYSLFEGRSRNEDKEEITSKDGDFLCYLECYLKMLETMTEFDDWRHSLGLLLQSIPFSDQVLIHPLFRRTFNVILLRVATDDRCEVHQTLLALREGKDGWFEIFCPGGICCDDDGELFAVMLEKLIGCCCRRKKFLKGIGKLTGALMLLALRENKAAIEALCCMLEFDTIESNETKYQAVAALRSTDVGRKLYAKLCERLIALKELQQKGGPRKLSLPSRSTDADLARLLSIGSFGNLECLSLAFTNVTSACAYELIKLPSLRYLNLWATQFGDHGVQIISEHLHRLQVLNLCETPVTDKGLLCLSSLKQLRKLNLNSTALTADTFEGLKEKLPALQECDIRYTDAWDSL